MRFSLLIFAAGALTVAGAEPFGDSVVGYFVTPPGWAVSGGDIDNNSSLPQVDARYTLAGTNARLVRLNVPAALGMCATLDACAERWWVPAMSYPSPGHRAWYEFIDFYAGPPADWAAFDFTSDPFDLLSSPLWPYPNERVISNTFGRIFFRASDMLEDVRSRLRTFAAYPTDSAFGPALYGSSLFGGIDSWDFDWCERSNAVAACRAAFDAGLCYDWSCLSNSAWSGIYTAAPNTVLLDYVNLDQDEFTNVVVRCSATAKPPLPEIYDILTANGSPTLLRGWLSYSNITSRISANDFGWMNSLLAALDKTYLVTSYSGLPIVIFKELDIHGEATGSQSITNGYFYLSLGGFDETVASLSGADFSDNEPPPPVIRTAEGVYDMRAIFAVQNKNAYGSLYAHGSSPLVISADQLEQKLPNPLASNEFVRVDFFVYNGESEGQGPLIDIYAISTNFEWETRIERVRVLDEVSGVPVVWGSVRADAVLDLLATGERLRYASLGAPWGGTNSVPHVRPLPDQVARRFVSRVALQLAARRDWNYDDMSLDEYAAFSGSAYSGSLDYEAAMLAELVRDQCADDAASMFGVDFSGLEEHADSVVGDWRRSALASMRPYLVDSATNGRWYVSTVVPAGGNAYLVNTNDAIRLFEGEPPNWSELPQLAEGIYHYADVVAEVACYASTNAPSAELSAEFDFSAAVYWNWPALPHASTE